MKPVLPLETGKETSAPVLPRLIIALGSTLLLAACASETANQQAAASGVAAVQEECRSVPVTGSSFPRRTCRTAEEWAVIDGQERAGAGEFGRQTRENSALVNENSQQGPY